MRRTGLTVHHGMFKMASTELQILMTKSKPNFYNSKITNYKLLFKVVDTLLHRLSLVPTSCVSKQSLADDFGKLCQNQIDVIWRYISSVDETNLDIEDGCLA